MQKIGIGYEFYKKMIDDRCYYVDKTLLIRDIVEQGGEVTLFTRPRRFGKTLALTMLQAFFECELDRDGNKIDNSRYFEGKKIMEAGEDITSMMGQYPVIFLTLKSSKQPDFENAFYHLVSNISSELSRHRYVLKSDRLEPEDREKFEKLLERPIQPYAGDENNKRLLDEYDVPLESSYFAGYYDRMDSFIRALFESSLKTNPALKFAVVTGCLRISKESIFTGLNHLIINSVLDSRFTGSFGFTVAETENMLEDYGIRDAKEEVRDWYDGYLFGEKEIYNPWSVINYVYAKTGNPNYLPRPFWANTFSNSIIREMVENADDKVKEELEVLIDFGTIEKQIHEDITYDDIHKSEDNLWNFLFFTGYMRKVSERTEGEDVFLTMRIPNKEIRSIYRNQIRDWFDHVVKETDRNAFHQAVLDHDTKTMGSFVTGLLKRSISVFDGNESFYHGFLLSILIGVTDYQAKSNREAGDGRPDIVLYPLNPTDPAILFELKIRKKYNEMNAGLEEAFAQIRDKKYEEGILEDGYNGVVSFGGCFCKKSAVFGIMN